MAIYNIFFLLLNKYRERSFKSRGWVIAYYKDPQLNKTDLWGFLNQSWISINELLVWSWILIRLVQLHKSIYGGAIQIWSSIKNNRGAPHSNCGAHKAIMENHIWILLITDIQNGIMDFHKLFMKIRGYLIMEINYLHNKCAHIHDRLWISV